MKKLILLSLILAGCSSQENREISTFSVPQQLRHQYQKQNSSMFLTCEEHRVLFNTPSGEIIDVTDAEQMETTQSHVTLRKIDKIIYIEAVGTGVYFEYLTYSNSTLIFENYYFKL